ncbi:hypothetical protein DY000_02060634 [Brassica cretica]|uniref:Uncharacterized protein n=1 Tax=Brassica cretica TaxID=69181 RepID=A0ABQ7AU61_BRACR|nr:hypothetical protein DY000_02060634 [Brassica cretica]
MLASAVMDLRVAGCLRLQVGFGRRLASAAGLAMCRNGPTGHRFGYGRRFGCGHRFGYDRRFGYGRRVFQFGIRAGLASQFCPGWLFIENEICGKLVKTNLSLMKDTECGLSDFSKGRLGRYQHTYWKLNGLMKAQRGRMCGTCVVEVLVERGTMDTQVGRKDVVNPLVSGVVVKAKPCSTIEVAFLVWRKVVGRIRMGSRKRSDLVGQHTWRLLSPMLFIKMFQ